MKLTPRQKDFLLSKGKRINLLSGSVRSGKTFISLLKFALVVADAPINHEFIIVGKTVTSLKRNCLNLLESFVGTKNFYYSVSNKTAKLFGRTVYLEGANDERAEQKIRGMTLAGAYCDEVTLYPESFFSMLLSRLSIQGAKLWGTCNPDSPNHYIKRNYIDREDELDIAVWNFILTENEFLGRDYIENISKEYTGVFYNRFILGQWVRAEGIIYEKFANDAKSFYLPDKFDYNSLITVSFGVDFGGTKSATTFVMTGFTRHFKDVVILEAERHEKELDPVELERLFTEFIKECTRKYAKYGYTYADSEASILVRGLRNAVVNNRLQTTVVNARKMAILDRIKLVQKLIGQGRFWVHPHCTTVIKALQDAVWSQKNEDERLDDLTSDIDTLDAMEYSIEAYYRELTDYVVRN